MSSVTGDRRPRRDLAVRLLVSLHPAEFRERFGTDVVEAYRHGLERRIGAASRIRYRFGTLADLGIGVFVVRLSKLRSMIGRRGLLTVPAAGSGTLAAGVCCVSVCCPAHVALLGPLGLGAATLATVVEPVWPIVLVVAAGVLLLARQMQAPSTWARFRLPALANQFGVVVATSVIAFASFLPLFYEVLEGHLH